MESLQPLYYRNNCQNWFSFPYRNI